MANKVLIVAYYWPPAGGPGVQRWLKFVKYLPDFGIEPIVFIPDNPSYPILDESLVPEVPKGVKIIKYPIKEPYGLASTLSRKQTKTISSGILPKEKKQSLLQKLLLYVRGNFFIPDARVGWVKPSVKFLENFIDQNTIKTIITTGPPHSLHLIGSGLKHSNPALRWIADFRDPWTTIGYHDKLRMTEKTKAKHIKLERNVLQQADDIIVTSPSTKKEFEAITSKPISVITNGFDQELSGAQASVLEDNSFVMSHLGSLLSDRNPKILWQVLSELISEKQGFADAFHLYLAGRVSQEVVDSIKNHNLNNHFTLLGYIPHNQLNEIHEESSCLLLIEIDSEKTKAIIPGKVFEYLAAQKPIIALGPKDGDVKSIIEETQSGDYFLYTDSERLKEYIYKQFQNRHTALKSNTQAIYKYHRKALTEKLASLIIKKS